MATVFQNREKIHHLFDIQGGRNFGAERFIWYFPSSIFLNVTALIYSLFTLFCNRKITFYKDGTPLKICRVVFIIEKEPTSC